MSYSSVTAAAVVSAGGAGDDGWTVAMCLAPQYSIPLPRSPAKSPKWINKEQRLVYLEINIHR